MGYILDPNEFVQPFVGNDFASAKKKVLVLGESNYTDRGRLDTDHLIKMTKKYADPEDTFTYKFWTNIMQTLTQTHKSGMSSGEVQAFWDSIVLHDYVCDRHERRMRDPIPEEVWRKSRQPFLNILRIYKLDRIVIFSKSALRDIRQIKEVYLTNEKEEHVGIRKIVSTFDISTDGINVIPVIALPHPSWFFYYKHFSKFFQ